MYDRFPKALKKITFAYEIKTEIRHEQTYFLAE